MVRSFRSLLGILALVCVAGQPARAGDTGSPVPQAPSLKFCPVTATPVADSSVQPAGGVVPVSTAPCICGDACKCQPGDCPGKCPVAATIPATVIPDALDEVNAKRASRGLRPFVRDEGLTQAATTCAELRAKSLCFGHTANDFAALPVGVAAHSSGCAAYPAHMGWLSCCTYEDYTHAGAAYATGVDGKRYMHLFVRSGGDPLVMGQSATKVCGPNGCQIVSGGTYSSGSGSSCTSCSSTGTQSSYSQQSSTYSVSGAAHPHPFLHAITHPFAGLRERRATGGGLFGRGSSR